MLVAAVMLLAGMTLRGDNVTYTFSVLGSNNINNPSGDINSYISFTTQRNQSGTDPAYNGSAKEIRLYYHSSGNGGSITLTPKNGAVITEVKITATTTPVVIYNVDGGADATANLSGTTYTISGISVSSGLKIRNANTSTNTQFRFTSIEITYSAASCNDADFQFGVSLVKKLDTDANFTETAISAAGSTGAITYESTNTGVATVNTNTGEVTITGTGTTQIKAAIAATGSFCADETSYDLKVYPGANAKTYELVTSAAGLADDAKYLIVGIKGTEYYALGWQKPSNRHAIEIPVVNDEVTIGVATTVSAAQDNIYPYEITLKSHASEFMLYDALNAGYLRPNTGGSTGLYAKPQEAYWTISFTNDHADIECTGSEDGANFGTYVFMRFNAGNNPLFSCYQSGQQPVYLYKEYITGVVVDTDAPILTFDPADGTADVAVNTTITITSDEPLRKADGSELTDGDLAPTLVILKETDAGGMDVPFAATIDAAKKVITVMPSSALSNSQAYYAAINPIADTAGNLTALQQATFTTEVPLSPDAELLTYSINQISGNINADKTVDVVMPAGTDVTGLTATFTVSPGAAVTATGTPQVSGTTVNDFTNPVVYRIVSQDGNTTNDWTVTVSVVLSSEADIIAFTIPGQAGSTIIDADEATVIVTMPYGTDVTSLVPAITVSDYASISPLSGAAQDFGNIVNYTVTAQDGTVKVWNVSVIFTSPPPSNDNFIISFTLPGQTETTITIIDREARTVTVPMPVGISLVDLIPKIYISPGATISPSANTIRDFSNPVIYTVTSESGISALWVVKVQQGSADDGLLFSFISGTQIFHIENRTLGIGKVDIYASDGRLMYSGKRGTSNEFNNAEFNIDMSGYAGGMYIIRIFDKNYALTKTIKIIK